MRSSVRRRSPGRLRVGIKMRASTEVRRTTTHCQAKITRDSKKAASGVRGIKLASDSIYERPSQPIIYPSFSANICNSKVVMAHVMYPSGSFIKGPCTCLKDERTQFATLLRAHARTSTSSASGHSGKGSVCGSNGHSTHINPVKRAVAWKYRRAHSGRVRRSASTLAIT